MAMDQLYTDALKELEQVKAERDAAIKRAQVAEDEKDAVSSKCAEFKRDGEQWKSAHDDVAACEQALAAHVERLTDLLNELPDVMPVTPHLPMARIKGDYLERVDAAITSGPATAIARRDALKQAVPLPDGAVADVAQDLLRESGYLPHSSDNDEVHFAKVCIREAFDRGVRAIHAGQITGLTFGGENSSASAHLKAQWQAEALEDVEKHFRSKMDDPSLICLIEASHLGKIAEQYRSQAEADQ